MVDLVEDIFTQLVGVNWESEDDPEIPDPPTLINTTCTLERVDIEVVNHSGFMLRTDGSYHTSGSAAGTFYTHVTISGTKFNVQKTITEFYDDGSTKVLISKVETDELTSIHRHIHESENISFQGKWVNTYNDATGVQTQTYSLTGSGMPEWFNEYSYSLTGQVVTPCPT